MSAHGLGALLPQFRERPRQLAVECGVIELRQGRWRALSPKRRGPSEQAGEEPPSQAGDPAQTPAARRVSFR